MKGRYNISLSVDMDGRLNQFAYQTRKSRSSIIEDTLNQYLPGLKESPSIIHNNEISLLRERIENMESNFRDLESIIHIICVKIDSKESTKSMDIAMQTEGMTNIFYDIEESGKRTQINTVLDPEGWYSQNEVRRYLNPSINPNTQKGMISKAVASGKIETNGEKGKSCRVKGSSAIKWLESVQELK